MIEVRIFLSENRVKGLEVSGHSGLSEPGTDILCAAVSVLTENLGEAVTTLLKKKPEIKKSKGFYGLYLNDNDTDTSTELLFLSAILGLRNLSEQYPERLLLLNN